MATAARATVEHDADAESWYSLAPGEVAARAGVDPASGLSSEQAASLLAEHGPNALAAEQTAS